MKLQYIGDDFDGLTNDTIYEAYEDDGFYYVIDNSGEECPYSMFNPAPFDGSSEGGVWFIIEE